MEGNSSPPPINKYMKEFMLKSLLDILFVIGVVILLLLLGMMSFLLSDSMMKTQEMSKSIDKLNESVKKVEEVLKK